MSQSSLHNSKEIEMLTPRYSSISDVTPVSKNVYRGDFSSETISCVVTNMASTEHTILWQPDDTMSGDDISWISPSVTSELTLKKELVTDDHVYTCKVQADTKSEPAFIEVHLNFYCKYEILFVHLTLTELFQMYDIAAYYQTIGC